MRILPAKKKALLSVMVRRISVEAASGRRLAVTRSSRGKSLSQNHDGQKN